MAAINSQKIYISFVVIILNLWITVHCSSFLCPSTCSCLGPFVDCSERGLDTVPPDLPTWVGILDLSSNNIGEVDPEIFTGLFNLTKLDLSSNNIGEVDPEIFTGLFNLTKLHLNNNKIKDVDTVLFTKIPNLKTLKLSYNELEEVPRFPQNYNLTQLVISHNKIRVLESAALEPLLKLRQLDISFNRITILQNGSFPFLPNLHNLYLNNNRIGKLEMGCFGTMPNLEWLYLGKNQIPEIPKEIFKKLRQLKLLDLNKNKLRVIVGLTFNGSENLTFLKLKRNNITQLADGCFWGLKKIQELELDNNSLTQVKKAGLYGLESLKSMSLSSNQITSIEEGAWDFCPLLTSLDLTDNKLERIDSGTFNKLTALDGLWLNNNRISYIGIGAFDDLYSLKTLEMNNNQISWTIEDMHGPFEGLASLTRLSLEYNQVKTITKNAFQGLDLLRQLDLGHNQISTFQNNAFEDLKELKNLYINTSALLCDCELLWFRDWLEATGFRDSVSAKCAHPQAIRGTSVMEVQQFKCDEYPKPVIVTAPTSQIALKGNNVSLHCVAWSSSNSTMKIEWRKDNIAVVHAKINTTATMVDEGVKMESVLVIGHSQDEHAGAYQCVAENEVGPTYSTRAQLKVHIFPVFTKTPKDFTVKSGAKIQLECAALGQPVPEISWQKDGGDDFPAARERRMHIQQDNDIYFISSVKIEDMGVYSCMASNAAGTVVTNATLTVLEVPQFSEPMKDQEVAAGSTAVLECMAQGSPKPQLTWLKDGAPLEDSLTERHFFTAGEQLLVIVEARKEDSGRYTCEMTNTLGKDRDSMELTVTSRRGVAGKVGGLFHDNYTTTGIIIIAVVCCVVGTSLIWVVIIYQTRRKNEEYSSTPTEETTIPEVAYNNPADHNGCSTRTIYTAQGAYSKVYVNGSAGYNSLQNGGFNITHNPMAGSEDWEQGGIGEYEQRSDSRPLVGNTSGNPHKPSSGSRIERSGSSISVHSNSSLSSSASSSSCYSHHSPHCSTVMSTFHPYPLGNPLGGNPHASERGCGKEGESPIVGQPTMLQEGSPTGNTILTSVFVHKNPECSSQQHIVPHTQHSPVSHSQHSSSENQPLLSSSPESSTSSSPEKAAAYLEKQSSTSSSNSSNSSSSHHPSSSSSHENLDSNHNKPLEKPPVVVSIDCETDTKCNDTNSGGSRRNSSHRNSGIVTSTSGNNNNSPPQSPLSESTADDKNSCVKSAADLQQPQLSSCSSKSQSDNTPSQKTASSLVDDEPQESTASEQLLQPPHLDPSNTDKSNSLNNNTPSASSSSNSVNSTGVGDNRSICSNNSSSGVSSGSNSTNSVESRKSTANYDRDLEKGGATSSELESLVHSNNNNAVTV